MYITTNHTSYKKLFGAMLTLDVPNNSSVSLATWSPKRLICLVPIITWPM